MNFDLKAIVFYCSCCSYSREALRLTLRANSFFGQESLTKNFLQNSKINKLETLLVYQSQDFTKEFCKKLIHDDDEFTIKS